MSNMDPVSTEERGFRLRWDRDLASQNRSVTLTVPEETFRRFSRAELRATLKDALSQVGDTFMQQWDHDHADPEAA